MNATENPQLTRLLAIMARLRDPERGCEWDLAQDFASIAPYTLEEAYEVADAIARKDMADLRDELGDLLLQVVFHARMAQEGVDRGTRSGEGAGVRDRQRFARARPAKAVGDDGVLVRITSSVDRREFLAQSSDRAFGVDHRTS